VTPQPRPSPPPGRPGSAPPQPTSAPPQPPRARRIPTLRRHHGDEFTDEFAWLADRDNPETLRYLEAENAYTEAMMAGQAPLRETIFAEIRGRTQESDLSVPARKGRWWYYTRTVAGQQYPLHCRCPARPEDTTPPGTGESAQPADGEGAPPGTSVDAPLPGEEILLDCNELAAGSQFFALGAFEVSPDGRRLAYSTDFAGNERFTLRVKDLTVGEVLPDEIPGTFYGCAWSADGSALFYVTVDHAWRPYRVWRHRVGSPADRDEIVFEELDERFWVRAGLSRSERYVVISSASAVTSEVWLLDATSPDSAPRVVLPRRQGVEYLVDHQAAAAGGPGRLLILHNDGAPNFELAEVTLAGDGSGKAQDGPLADPAALRPVIGHRDDTRLTSVDAFAGYLVAGFRRDGLTGLRVLRADGSSHEIAFGEPLYTVAAGFNPEYRTSQVRLLYTSLATPDSVYDADLETGELALRKRKPVLTLPGQAPYDPADYEQHREWATAPDGTRVPISLVCRRGTPRDGSAPLLLYGYGSYEHSADPAFSIPRLSLLDRGFVYAIAHVRGGGELGRRWYEDGKLLAKPNSFTDFVACAEHLARERWTSPQRLIARGASAGGLLVGAAVNLAPEKFGGIVAQVPFVDALTSILDPSLPLTVTEWEEWGDPLHDPRAYACMKSYTPYENISGQRYPPVLATASLNDTRVRYAEPAKWIAALRARAAGGPFLLKTEMSAGHGGRSGRYDAWREEAMILAWIVATAGAGWQQDRTPAAGQDGQRVS
jgi:oligopeptidase B